MLSEMKGLLLGLNPTHLVLDPGGDGFRRDYGIFDSLWPSLYSTWTNLSRVTTRGKFKWYSGTVDRRLAPPEFWSRLFFTWDFSTEEDMYNLHF